MTLKWQRYSSATKPGINPNSNKYAANPLMKCNAIVEVKNDVERDNLP